MSTGIKAALAAVAAVVIMGICAVGCFVGINNDCVRAETGLAAQYGQNQNNYSNYFNKLKEMAQVPEMYAGDLQKLYDGAMKNRYGEGGSKAVFQFIQEHNPQLDASMYREVQQAIQSGRDSFMADQKTLLDKKRTYQNQLGVWPGGAIARFAGFPKVDLAKYDIVTNDETARAFDTKRAGPINLK